MDAVNTDSQYRPPWTQVYMTPIDRLDGHSSISSTTTYTKLRDFIDGALYTQLLVIDMYINIYEYMTTIEKCMIDK